MLNEMKYVYAVYQEKSFSKAAKKMFISQPALSNMVRKAEKELGTPIFDRSTIPLTLTKEGSYYIKSIEEIMLIQRNVTSYFNDLSELKKGTLSLGGYSIFCSFVFPDLISRFKRKYPGITIDLMEGNIKELRAGLKEETLDLVLDTAMDRKDKEVESFFYKKEKIILAVPRIYPVNKRVQPYKLSYEDIASQRFLSESVLPVPLQEFYDTPFITMKEGNDMHTRSVTMCRNAGFVQKVAISVDQVMTSLNIAATGLGAVFVRSDIVSCLPYNDKLVYYKLGDPLANRNVSFSVKKNRYITSAMREFLKIAGIKEI